MTNITVETHAKALPAAIVLGDNPYAKDLYTESNKALCRRFIQKIYNEGELSLLGNFMSPHAVNHELADSFGDTGPAQGHASEWMADFVYLYRHAFPDLRLEILNQIAEGDQVVTRLRIRGTQKNALMSIAASGRKIDIAGIRVDRMAGGRIVESWVHLDALGMLRQLGALPALNRQPQVAPVFHETAPGARLPFPGWNPVPALPQPAFVS